MLFSCSTIGWDEIRETQKVGTWNQSFLSTIWLFWWTLTPIVASFRPTFGAQITVFWIKTPRIVFYRGHAYRDRSGPVARASPVSHDVWARSPPAHRTGAALTRANVRGGDRNSLARGIAMGETVEGGMVKVWTFRQWTHPQTAHCCPTDQLTLYTGSTACAGIFPAPRADF